MVHVVDSIMGSGKTSAAIQYMHGSNHNASAHAPRSSVRLGRRSACTDRIKGSCGHICDQGRLKHHQRTTTSFFIRPQKSYYSHNRNSASWFQSGTFECQYPRTTNPASLTRGQLDPDSRHTLTLVQPVRFSPKNSLCRNHFLWQNAHIPTPFSLRVRLSYTPACPHAVPLSCIRRRNRPPLPFP